MFNPIQFFQARKRARFLETLVDQSYLQYSLDGSIQAIQFNHVAVTYLNDDLLIHYKNKIIRVRFTAIDHGRWSSPEEKQALGPKARLVYFNINQGCFTQGFEALNFEEKVITFLSSIKASRKLLCETRFYIDQNLFFNLYLTGKQEGFLRVQNRLLMEDDPEFRGSLCAVFKKIIQKHEETITHRMRWMYRPISSVLAQYPSFMITSQPFIENAIRLKAEEDSIIFHYAYPSALHERICSQPDLSTDFCRIATTFWLPGEDLVLSRLGLHLNSLNHSAEIWIEKVVNNLSLRRVKEKRKGEEGEMIEIRLANRIVGRIEEFTSFHDEFVISSELKELSSEPMVFSFLYRLIQVVLKTKHEEIKKHLGQSMLRNQIIKQHAGDEGIFNMQIFDLKLHRG